MYRIDLHTHSVASPDGGITAVQYQQALTDGRLDIVAITDHNRIDFAQELQTRLGNKIIVGEEIMTTAGEIVGLFLTELIPPGLTPDETVRHIKKQGGYVYIPHPFETFRKGLRRTILDEIADDIDLIEVYNGRAFLQKRSEQAVTWARLHATLPVASSDAHGAKGLGKTVTVFSELPDQEQFIKLLAAATLLTGRPSIKALLYPKYHKLHKKLWRHA
jgi:predicted metal-dependent phosphoesterase TrpH